MATFHAFATIALIIIVALVLIAILMFWDYLKIFKNQLYDIYNKVQSADNGIDHMWGTTIKIRDDTIAIYKLLENDDEDPEEDDDDISDGGWATAPCPVCGGPAHMDSTLPVGDGYYVMCGKNAKAYEHCDYGVCAGGPTRKTAAFKWNEAVMTYCNHKAMNQTICDKCPNKDTDICKTCNLFGD